MPGTILGTLGVKLNALTADFERKMAVAKSKLDGVSQASKAVAKISTAAFAATGAAIYSVASTAADFEYSMARVGAVSQATAAQQGELEGAARKFAAATQFSAKQVADGMSFMAMAGFKSSQIISGMPSVLSLASAGMIDLATASDITTNIVASMGLKLSELGHANDVLVSAMTGSNVNTQMLGEAFKYIGPVAKSAGVSFEEITAAIGKLGNVGIQGSRAGTTLRRAIANLINPTGESAEMLDRLGVTVKDATGKLLPLDRIIEQLEPHADDTAAIMQIFGLIAGPGMAALISQGADSLRAFTKRLSESGGLADKISNKVLNTFKGQMDILSSKFDEAKIAIGKGLIPVLRQVNAVFQNLLNMFNALSPAQKAQVGRLIAITAGVTGLVAILTGFIALLPALLGGISAIATVAVPIVAAIAGIAAVVAAVIFTVGALKKAWEENLFGIRDLITRHVNAWRTAFDWLADKIAVAWEFWADVAKTVLEKVKGWFESWINAHVAGLRAIGEFFGIDKLASLQDISIDLEIENALEAGGDVGEAIAEKMEDAAEFVSEAWGEGVDVVKGVLGPLFDDWKGFFEKLTKAGGGNAMPTAPADETGLPTTGAATPAAAAGEVSDAGDVVMNAAQNLSSALGEAGGVVGAFLQGLQGGGIFEAFANAIVEILKKTQFIGELLTALSPIMDLAVEAFERILSPLLPLIKSIIELVIIFLHLSMVLSPLTNIIRWLAPVFEYLGKAISWLARVLALVIGTVFRIIASIVGIVKKSWAEKLRRVANQFAAYINPKPLANEMNNAGNAAAYAGGEIEGLGDKANDVAEQLSNIPEGFKVAAARFAAMAPVTPTTAAITGASPSSLTEAIAGRGTQVGTNIENVYIDAVDPDDAWDKMQSSIDRKNFQQTGTSIGTVGPYAAAEGG